MDKDKFFSLIHNAKTFSENIQKKLGRDRAVSYTVYFLINNHVEATFQRICVAVYKLFPESFSLSEFPEYLDSRTVRNCLWHCTHKSKGWLTGSDKTHYSITEKGKEEILVFETLKNSNNPEELPIKFKLRKKDLVTKPKDKEINYLSEIKNSTAFIKFVSSNLNEISLLEIKKSLGGDRYSSLSYFEDKIKFILDISQSYNEKMVIKYLAWIKENWRFE